MTCPASWRTISPTLSGLGQTGDVWLNSDVLVVLGGDGTILRAIRMSMPRKIPVLGVHMGYLGFLTEVTEGEVIQSLEDMKAEIHP